jgi:hypothetical protein
VVDGDRHLLGRMWHPLLGYEAHADALRLFGEEGLPGFD